MTTWIETSKTHQNGEPVTRKIKIPSMDRAIWFTDNAYAEVSDNVADILANNLDSISKVSEPGTPGTYYGDAGENTITEVVVSDGAFDSLTVETLDVDSAGASEVSGEVYAREFSGSDLSEKVSNALDSLAGGFGRVRITPRTDGEPWSWDTDLTIDTTQYNGLELDFDRTVRIEYTGTGWPITINGSGGAVDSQADISGGVWTAPNDLSGWLRIQDCFGTKVYPTHVTARNSSNDAVGVAVENIDTWSESSRIGGSYNADIGLDFRPASVTGGTDGTESFHDTFLDNPKINSWNIGIRMRGYFDYCHVQKPIVWSKTDNVSFYVLGASRMDGTTITSLKAETAAGSNGIAIETTGEFEGFWYGPTIIGGRIDINGETVVENGNATGPVPQYRTFQRKTGITDLSGRGIADFEADGTGFFNNLQLQSEWASISATNMTLEAGGNDYLHARSGGIHHQKLNPQDVRQATGEKGEVRYHDPSINGDGNTEGPAFFNGQSWISQVDNTTIS